MCRSDRTTRFLTLVAAVSVSGACDRDSVSARDASSPAAQERLSLNETYHRLRELCARRSYLAMRAYIDPEHCDSVIDLLIAMDELLAANADAQAAILAACPGCDPRQFDMSPMANRLEMLSRDVELIGLNETGDAATATLHIADRLPYERARFERRDGRWIYLPGPGARDLVPLTRTIAEALGRVARVVSKGPHTPEQIASEYHLRVGRKLKRLTTSTSDPDT